MNIYSFFLFLPCLLTSATVMFFTVFTCEIYFCGETKIVKVEEVIPLGVRDATATTLVVDEGVQYKVYSCPKNVMKGDEVEVFSSSIFGCMVCTNISGVWIAFNIIISIILGFSSYVLIKDFILSKEIDS